MKNSKHYTKEELKYVKDLSMSDQDVGILLSRSTQAIYCKRRNMRLIKVKKHSVKSSHSLPTKPKRVRKYIPIVEHSETPVNISKITQLVLGNVTIDLVSKTLTVHF